MEENDEASKNADESKPSEPAKFKLRKPIEFGKDLISELELKPTARAFKNARIPISPGGGFVLEPYALALVGLGMAGYRAGAEKILDDMDPKDMGDLALLVFGFLG